MIFVVQKFAVLTDVAVTVAVATIAKTVVVKLRLYRMNGFLGHFLRGCQLIDLQ